MLTKLDKYGELKEEILRGNSSIIFKLTSKDQQDSYADKISNLTDVDNDGNKGITKSVLREISILRRLNHPNIIDVIRIDSDIHLIIPLGIKNFLSILNSI